MDELRYRRVLHAVASTPWAILPSKLALIAELLAYRADGGRLSEQEIQERIAQHRHVAAWPQLAEAAAAPGRGPGYATVAGNAGSVAVLPLYGVIMPRASLFSDISGGAALDRFRQAFRQAQADPAVTAILIDVDSGGGTVNLVPETAAELRAARGAGKPIVAIADTLCASAAYYIACQADELVVTPSGEVGSIGVIAIHQDVSRMLDAMGVTTTMITFGQNKADGWPYEPLSDGARQALQESVDEFGQMFEADVAKGRNVPVATVHGTFGQGRVFGASQAVKLGMADRVDTIENTVARLVHAPSRARIGTSNGAAAALVDIEAVAALPALPARQANAVPPHSTTVIDEPWDGPGEVAKLNEPVTKARGFGMYAWYDPDGADPDGDGYPDAKDDWKFEHHQVVDGEPREAVVSACRDGLARLDQAHIPAGDREGVREHLQRHIDDFHAHDQNAADAPVAVAGELTGALNAVRGRLELPQLARSLRQT